MRTKRNGFRKDLSLHGSPLCAGGFPLFCNISILREGKRSSSSLWSATFLFIPDICHLSPTQIFCVSAGKGFLISLPTHFQPGKPLPSVSPNLSSRYVLCSLFTPSLLSLWAVTKAPLRDPRTQRFETVCPPLLQRAGVCNVVPTVTEFAYSQVFQNTARHGCEGRCLCWVPEALVKAPL